MCSELLDIQGKLEQEKTSYPSEILAGRRSAAHAHGGGGHCVGELSKEERTTNGSTGALVQLGSYQANKVLNLRAQKFCWAMARVRRAGTSSLTIGPGHGRQEI